MDSYITIFACCILEGSVVNLSKNQIIIMDVELTEEKQLERER